MLDPHGGRATRRVDVPAPVLRFGTHSLVTDGWFAAGRDLIFGPLWLREHDGLCVRQAWGLLDTEYELVELADDGG